MNFKSKQFIFILLLICGILLAYSLYTLDFSSIKKGENLISLGLPITLIISSILLLVSYVDKVKEKK